MKIKEKLKAHASKIAAAVTGGAVMIAGAVPAFAEGAASDVDGLKSAMSTAFGQIKTDAFSMMGTALPIGLGIIGAVLAVKLGIKFFKKFSNAG